MGVFKEFREFAIRGNVIDLAVGVIIGGAFGKIVTSLVNDLIMPPIGYLIGGVKFTDLKFVLKEAVLDTADKTKILEPAVTINYGTFIQMIFEFLIISFAVFMMVRFMNRMHIRSKKEEEAKSAVNPEPEPTKEEKLLTEIRDLLRTQR